MPKFLICYTFDPRLRFFRLPSYDSLDSGHRFLRLFRKTCGYGGAFLVHMLSTWDNLPVCPWTIRSMTSTHDTNLQSSPQWDLNPWTVCMAVHRGTTQPTTTACKHFVDGVFGFSKDTRNASCRCFKNALRHILGLQSILKGFSQRKKKHSLDVERCQHFNDL